LKLNNVEVFKAVDFLIDYQPELIHRHMNILDIGTRIGSAIKRFNQRGFAKTKGIDLSPGALKNALKYGFNVWEEDIVDSMERDSGFYQVVFCRHVLEHVTNLEKAISNMHKKLSQNGILFLIVPLYEPEDEIITTHNFQFIHEDSLLNLVLNSNLFEKIFYQVKFGSEKEMWLIARKI